MPNHERSPGLLYSLSAVLLLLMSGPARSLGAAELLPPGFRPQPLGIHALVGGRIVTRPGETLENATLVIRDGVIQAVGKNLQPPADARVWDMKGKTIYAGFIDSYLVLEATNPPIATDASEPNLNAGLKGGGVKFYGAPGAQLDMGNPGPGYEMSKITPEFRAVRGYTPREKTLQPLRELGFTAGVIAPGKGIIRGTSALIALSEADPNEVVLKPDVFQHIAFETLQPGERSYPGSLMGVIAAVRQSFFDAQHYSLEQSAYREHPQGRKPPEFDPALEALGPAATRKTRVIFEPGSALMVDRAGRLATELGLEAGIVSCGQEWRRPELAKATGATFIVPLDFPALPKISDTNDWDQVQLDQLRKWDWAPENPAVLRKQGLEVALTCYGLGEKKKFRDNLRLAVDRGLAETDALAGLTTVPAKLCGAENLLGSIEPGKLANLTVVDGETYFAPDAKVSAVWIEGRVFEIPGEEAKPAKADVPQTATAATETGQTHKEKDEPEKSPKPPELATQEKKPTDREAKSEPAAKKDKNKERLRDLQKSRVALDPLSGRGPLAQPTAILISAATLWTCAPEGRLEESDLLMVNGKIKAIGKGLKIPEDLSQSTVVIDGHGLHVTPGLIDCHSHTAILGGVNEMTLPSTAMVRIQDVVNADTDTIYEQLAGGVTTVNLLHGSANPIGGQNCVIKLRDGAPPNELVFAAAPPGIKFALGENVKQSNWGEQFTSRFPQTRMGVGTFIANRFTAAQQYLDRQQTNAWVNGVPPRRNLELEAIGEIIQGKRWIHCHSYRQDEILMLIRLMETFGVKVATFQHVLEGYKVADEIAAHGAGGSTFSDWWAYKFEVYDAIPYNGALMHDRGVVVSFNSDSSELARRLYTEAAKAVKYGATSETEALKFVTLNPAQQLRIDRYVGSLEIGKDADIAIWSKSPLDSRTVCLQTWIDGKKYFDRALNRERASKLAKEREDLLAKAKQLEKLSAGGDESSPDKSDKQAEKFWRVSLEHQFDRRERDCLDTK